MWPDREIAIAQQPDKTCYIVLDQRLIERYSHWPHFISTAPKIAYAYVKDYLRLRPDVATRATTVEQLAKRRSLDPTTLRQTIDTVNALRSQRSEPPLAGNDWVLLGAAKAYFTTTEGGVAINEQFQVLDSSGAPIAGLYAVGQVGLGGQILWGHGLHIAWAITSGRLCGRALADRAPTVS
ncbi:MAG: FAD-binding protein [Planctomycetaceae bacterium]|nr:FAD-binding protein [Planctomycetaceae bacterium]